ncbi:MAG: CoA-binding protein [Pseudomonadota bacterium]
MSFANPSPDEIKTLLQQVKTIAVVGLSPKASRPSHSVSKAMQEFGYRIIPVRPAVDEVLGEKAWPELSALPVVPDLVDVFRASEHVDPIVDACIELGIKAIWLQDGVVNEAAANRAKQAGMTVIMDRCIYRDYIQLVAPNGDD